jgi:hypothetical protein
MSALNVRQEGEGKKFLATIYRIWMLRYIDVPEDVAKALAGKLKRSTGVQPTRGPKYIPVIATAKKQSVQTTLLPAGGGRYRMQFNSVLRKAAEADVGDAVTVSVKIDRESRERAIPADLRAALKKHAKAGKAFESAPPSHRRQIIKWMDSAKSEAARRRRIEVVLDRMLERAILGPARKRKE